MERQQALKIINALAIGVHPATGEAFHADSPYRHPETVRALVEAIRCMQNGEPATNQRPGQKSTDERTSLFVRWTPAEEQRLVDGFDAGKTSAELAKLHNRSAVAIEARLLKLGKIDVSAITMASHYPGSPNR